MTRRRRHRRPWSGWRSPARLAATLLLVVAVLPASHGDPAVAAVAAEHGPGNDVAHSATGSDVVLLGDSLTEQAFGILGGPTAGAPAHLRRWSHVGWTLRAAADHAGTAVTSSRTATLLLAVGPNDAAEWDHGWNADDVARWQGVLDRAPASTCVAVVLPGWGAPLDGTPWAQAMARMRADVTEMVAARQAAGSPTITVDWQPVVTAHPDYLAADGIHITSPEAARARHPSTGPPPPSARAER